MKARVLTGSKQEIAQKVAGIDGDIREAIVFVEEPATTGQSPAGTFAEMEPFTVQQPRADDSREAIYSPVEGE